MNGTRRPILRLNRALGGACGELSMASLESRVIAVVESRLYHRICEKKVAPSASFSDDLDADSLDKVEVIMALEDEFGVTISDLDAERIYTVKDAIDFITRTLSERDVQPSGS
jgi:acyl carrier protein